MIDRLMFIAQHDPGYRSGQLWMNFGAILMLIGLAGVGLALIASKPKPGTAPGNVMAGRITGVIVMLLGIVLAWYMWQPM